MIAWVRQQVRRLLALVRRRERERAMDAEMRFHLEMEERALHREGWSAKEARRRAHVRFGGVERFKEEGRDARGTRVLEDLWQDLGYAVRQLRASPGFAAATVLTLALGISAATTMQSNRRYIRAEANKLRSANRVLYLSQGAKSCPHCIRLAAGNYLTMREQARSFEGVSMLIEWEPIQRGADQTVLIDGQQVTTDFFQTLHIPALLGRTLVPEDSAPDRRQVVVLTETMWRTRFGADRAILGTEITLDRVPYRIVGVVADAYVYPRDTELWAPLVLTAAQAAERAEAEYTVVARLRDGLTHTAAASEVAGIGRRVANEFAAELEGIEFAAAPIHLMTRPPRDVVESIFDAAVGLVLLISCINLAGLLIARLKARERELAVRRALGAASGRIVRQLMAETMLLATLGGTLGVVLAGLRARIASGAFALDGFMLAAGVALGLLCGLVIGIWPALRFARPVLASDLRTTTRGATASTDSARGRRTLVIAEVALSILLLASAGLLIRSFYRIYQVDAGFETDRLLTLRINSSPKSGHDSDPTQFDRLAQALEQVPGIERAGATLGIPFGKGSARGRFEIEGDGGQPVAVRMGAASPGYFESLGVPLLRGRAFTSADQADAPRVAIINQELAQRYFGGAALGRGLIIDKERWEVVGVVANMFYGDVEQISAPEIYRPLQQWSRSTVWITARTRTDPAGLAETSTGAVRRFDPDLAVTRLLTMNQLRATDMGSERHILRTMSGFALAALLISAIGLYGLISYSVTQRRREFGVRLALGARRGTILRLVLGQGIRLAGIGALLGTVAALGATRVLRSLLFGVTTTDLLTFAAVIAATCTVALLATYLPARRATLVDPIRSLREE